MKRLSIALAALLLLTLNISALAQDDYEEESDLLEICFNGGFGLPMGGLSDWHDSLGAKTGWSVGLDFGYFATPKLVVGLSFQYTELGIDASDAAEDLKHRLYNPNLYTKYYFSGESNFEPYVKVHVGIENPKFTSTLTGPKYRAISYDASLAYGIGAGVFYYMSDYSGLYLEMNYHAASTSDAKKEYIDQTLVFDENVAVLDIHAGVRVLVGSGD